MVAILSLSHRQCCSAKASTWVRTMVSYEEEENLWAGELDISCPPSARANSLGRMLWNRMLVTRWA
jgi:hypothetical protein